jgi:hypothetical protein
MHVLQHDPETFTVTSIKLVVGEFILALTERNSVQVLFDVKLKSLGKILDILDWIDTRR